MPAPNGVQGNQPAGNATGDANDASADIKALAGVVNGLVGTVEALAKQNSQIQESQSRMFSPDFIQSLRGQSQSTPTEEPIDVNELDNAGVIQHTIKGVAGLLDERLGAVNKQMNVLMARERIADTRSQHTDFNEFLPKMQELWKTNPGLHPEEAYKMAKYASPEAIEEAESLRKAKDAEAELASRQTGAPGPGASFNLEPFKDLTPDEQINKAAGEILKSFD